MARRSVRQVDKSSHALQFAIPGGYTRLPLAKIEGF